MIVVRELESRDAPAAIGVHVAAVHGLGRADYPEEVLRVWSDPRISQARIDHFVANEGRESRLVAEVNGKVVGFGAVNLAAAELVACYVRPEAARQGVGTALVLELERRARAAGLAELTLEASLTAEAFYRRHGYREVRRYDRPLRRSWGTLELAAIEMRKRL